MTNTPRKSVRQFFDEKVLPYEGDECLLWPFSTRLGYGLMRVNGRSCDAHRYLCELHNGPPPTTTHHAAHSCGNGRFGCVTKKHLSWKTPKENYADQLLHGTSCRGENHGGSKLTELDVREIRSLKGKESLRFIANKYSVTKQAISLIHKGENWSWLRTE